MPFTYRRRARPVTTTTRTTRTTRAPRTTAPRTGLFSRRRAAPAKRSHVHATPVHHQKRRPSMKDKVSGALLKLKGSLTHRPAVKVSTSPP